MTLSFIAGSHLARLDFIASLTLVNIILFAQRKMLCALQAIGSSVQVLALFSCLGQLRMLFLVGNYILLLFADLAADAFFVPLKKIEGLDAPL